MQLSIISGFLRVLAVVAQNPAVAGVGGVALAKYINLGASLIERGDAARAGLESLTRDVEKMVSEGREPTPEEWAGLKDRSDAAHDAIQNS